MPERERKDDFEKVVAVVGKPGLYLMRAQTSRGFLLEPLQEGRRGHVVFVPATSKIIFLHKTGMYVKGGEKDTIPLQEVFTRLTTHRGRLPVEAEPSAQLQFLRKLIPELDTERVYPSDARKVLRWYAILKACGMKFVPDEKTPEEEKASPQKKKKTTTRKTTRKKKQ